jgi:iron complex outermembrane receptor protein
MGLYHQRGQTDVIASEGFRVLNAEVAIRLGRKTTRLDAIRARDFFCQFWGTLSAIHSSQTGFTRLLFRTLAAILLAAHVCLAQMEQPFTWLKELTALEANSSGSFASRLTQLAALRSDIQSWIGLHPGSSVALPIPTEPPANEEQMGAQIGALKTAVQKIIRNDPSRTFALGVTVVNVTASAAALSPLADSIDQTELQNRDALTVNRAIEYLPGVSVDKKAPRNQTGISIGGFDMRQVPLYLDSVPVYAPFDGFVDLTRYLTSDVAEIQVAKGWSSPLLGPNLLGGVVNLVTREPRERLEGEAFLGAGSGKLLKSGARLGSRWRKFYVQGSMDWLSSDFFPVAGNFRLNPQQPTEHRVNSYQRDERFRGRAGWTPRGRDSYVFSYTNQKGNSGDPPYSGVAPSCPAGNVVVSFACVTPKYWQWPYWNSDSYYLNSNTGIGEMTSVQARSFYARYPNQLDMFDDATYSTMNKNASSGMLTIDDHSLGVSGQIDTQALRRNALSASFFVKEDTHREQTTTFSARGAAVTPWQTDRDRQSSFGFQDVVTLTPHLRLSVGFSADHLGSLSAQDLSTDRTQLVPFQVAGLCPASSTAGFANCTDHLWTYNPLVALSYRIGRSGTLFATFAKKSRFPTLKDRYSYKAGRAIPNPALAPEHASNWSVGYSRAFGLRTIAQIDLFRSDVGDEIANVSFLSPLCTGGGKGAGCMQAVNVARETHQGFNISVRSTPTSRLTLDANYSYLNRSTSATPGVFPTGTPRQKAVGAATTRLPHAVLAILSVRYQSGIVAMSDNGLPLATAKFATMDTAMIVPIRVGVNIQAGVKNLLDRNYYYWEGFAEEGRTWYATIRFRF